MTAPFYFLLAPCRLALLGVALCVSVSALLVAAEPAPAVIRTIAEGEKGKSNSFDKTFVFHESVDGIDFAVDDPKSANKLNLKYGTYTVEYGVPDSIDYMKAKVLEEAGTLDKALEAYQRAAIGSKMEWVKEDSQLRGAQAAVQLKKYDDALALVAALEKDAARSTRLAKALLVRGQAQIAKGDAAGATKTFTALTAMAKEWGPDAAIFGARGQAGLLSADKKFAEAADVLAKLLARIDAVKQHDEVGGLVLALAAAQRDAGKPADALITIQAYVWKDIDADQQAQLHVLWGTILAQQGDAASLTAAYDQAALANVTKGASAATLAAAKALAISVNDKLAKDATVSAADKAEFKRTLSFF